LVGKERIEKELSKKTSKAYVQQHVAMYKKLNGGAVPKLLFPKRSVQGEFTAVDALKNLIKQDAQQ
jgi:protein-disulfide isomerase